MDLLWLHLTILAATAIVIAIADHDAFQYVTGKSQVLDPKRTKLLHGLVWAGLLGMIGSSLLMAWPAIPALISVPGFVIKMLFVAMLVVNAIFIGDLMHVAFERPFSLLSGVEKTRLMISGAVSTIGWVGAVTAAILTFGNIISWIQGLF